MKALKPWKICYEHFVEGPEELFEFIYSFCVFSLGTKCLLAGTCIRIFVQITKRSAAEVCPVPHQ